MNSAGLQALLQVESEPDLKRVCKIAQQSSIDDEDITRVQKLLSTDKKKAELALANLNSLAAIKDKEKLRSQFPETFPKAVAELITDSILQTRSDNTTSFESSLMPQLKDFNWRVDVKVASDATARISVPTCLLQLQIEEPPRTVGRPESQRRINVELTKEAMDAVLDGLGKIRDQLSNIAK